MQHCRIKATDGIEFWIRCKRPAFLSSFGLLQVIQNKRPWCWNAAYVTAGLKNLRFGWKLHNSTDINDETQWSKTQKDQTGLGYGFSAK